MTKTKNIEEGKRVYVLAGKNGETWDKAFWGTVMKVIEQGDSFLVADDNDNGHNVPFKMITNVHDGSATIREEKAMILSPDEQFEKMESAVDMVIYGITPSFCIFGTSGVGKTYMVLERLKAAGRVEGARDGYIFIKGHSSPLGLYMTLYDNRNATVIFDDCDSVFGAEYDV